MSEVQDSKRGPKLANVPAYGRLAGQRGKHPHQPLTAMRNKRPRKHDHKEKLGGEKRKRDWGCLG